MGYRNIYDVVLDVIVTSRIDHQNHKRKKIKRKIRIYAPSKLMQLLFSHVCGTKLVSKEGERAERNTISHRVH